MKKKIKLFNPLIGHQEELAIKKTLKSRFWASGAGTGNVLKFENEFNNYIGSNYCVALNSGTAALHLALSLIDIKNKEVILPSFTFVSTAHSIVYNGGKPVFIDVDPHTLCIYPDSIQKSITKKTKIILPVHFGGMACNLDEIISICKEYDINLIEDAAHAAGTTFKRKKIGTHGIAVCFSFHPVKNLAMPTGGAIALNGKKSNAYRKILQSRRWCGISNRKGSKYDVNQIGWNYYMNEFSAAIGLEQLKKLDTMNRKRKQIAKIYSKRINLDRKMPFNEECSYQLYWIQVKNRDNFMKKMNERGIETGIHYLPLHKMSFYKGNQKLPITQSIEHQIVSIPMHPNLTNSDVSWIIKSVNELN